MPAIFADLDGLDVTGSISEKVAVILRHLVEQLRTSSMQDEGLTPTQIHYKKFMGAVGREIDNFKESIKAELRMEMFLELDKMRAEMMNPPDTAAVRWQQMFEDLDTATVMPTCSSEHDEFAEESEPKSDQNAMSEVPVPADIPDVLKSNPLFAKVLKSLDRSADDDFATRLDNYISDRRADFGDDVVEEMRRNFAKCEIQLGDNDDNEVVSEFSGLSEFKESRNDVDEMWIDLLRKKCDQ